MLQSMGDTKSQTRLSHQTELNCTCMGSKEKDSLFSLHARGKPNFILKSLASRIS